MTGMAKEQDVSLLDLSLENWGRQTVSENGG